MIPTIEVQVLIVSIEDHFMIEVTGNGEVWGEWGPFSDMVSAELAAADLSAKIHRAAGRLN